MITGRTSRNMEYTFIRDGVRDCKHALEKRESFANIRHQVCHKVALNHYYKIPKEVTGPFD